MYSWDIPAKTDQWLSADPSHQTMFDSRVLRLRLLLRFELLLRGSRMLLYMSCTGLSVSFGRDSPPLPSTEAAALARCGRRGSGPVATGEHRPETTLSDALVSLFWEDEERRCKMLFLLMVDAQRLFDAACLFLCKVNTS